MQNLKMFFLTNISKNIFLFSVIIESSMQSFSVLFFVRTAQNIYAQPVGLQCQVQTAGKNQIVLS